MYKILLFLFSLGFALLTGCSSPPSPEDQVKAIIQTCSTQYPIPGDQVQHMQATLTRITDSLATTDPAALQTLTPALEKARVWLRHVEVLVLHDHCMPRMGQMVDLKKQLGALQGLPKPAADSVAAAIAGLDKADDDMMQWMRAFRSDVPRQAIQHATAMRYLEEQLTIVTHVDSQIFASIDQAQLLLDHHAH